MATKKFTPAKGRRAVIVEGLRTPFLKAFSDFMKMDTIALGAAAVPEPATLVPVLALAAAGAMRRRG